MKKLILFLALITVSVFTVRAEVKLPDIFGDNMVLQQQSLVAFWGKAEPKSKILITNTWSKTKVNVIADENTSRTSHGIRVIEWPYRKNIYNRKPGKWRMILTKSDTTENYSNIIGIGV